MLLQLGTSKVQKKAAQMVQPSGHQMAKKKGNPLVLYLALMRDELMEYPTEIQRAHHSRLVKYWESCLVAC